MSKQKKHHELFDLLLLAGGVAVGYLWFKGEPLVPDAPAGSDFMTNTLVQKDRVKAGYDSLFNPLATVVPTPAQLPVSTSSTPIITDAPVIVQKSCLSGIGTFKVLPSDTLDTGSAAVQSSSLKSKALPMSPEQIAAAAVTAKPKLATCS